MNIKAWRTLQPLWSNGVAFYASFEQDRQLAPPTYNLCTGNYCRSGGRVNKLYPVYKSKKCPERETANNWPRRLWWHYRLASQLASLGQKLLCETKFELVVWWFVLGFAPTVGWCILLQTQADSKHLSSVGSTILREKKTIRFWRTDLFCFPVLHFTFLELVSRQISPMKLVHSLKTRRRENSQRFSSAFLCWVWECGSRFQHKFYWKQPS